MYENMWGENLVTGIEEIDSQHKELFEKLSNLLKAINQEKGEEEVGNVIQFLEDYVVSHFGTEEQYMVTYLYPDYKSHKDQHKKFIEDFRCLKEEIKKQGISHSLVTQIETQLCDWLFNHICKLDKTLGRYLEEKIK